MSSVDVFVPCYRYGHFLRECVESVLTQGGVDVRVLIIDDASPDNTVEVCQQLAREDPRVTFTRHPTNKGHIVTYNEGIEWASSDYLLLLSADDYLLPGALKRATDLMRVHTEVGFACGAALVLNDSGDTREVKPLDGMLTPADEHIIAGYRFIELTGARNWVPTPTAVIRTEIQKQVGGYRSELPHSGDMEMWLRLAAHASVGVVGTLQAVYREHGENMSRAYYDNHYLSDVLQRKAAVEWFMRSCGDRLVNGGRVRDRMLSELARDSVGYASAAFNTGEMDLSRQFADLALNLCPDIRRSAPWTKLAWKRSIGLTAWRALQPTIASLRIFQAAKH